LCSKKARAKFFEVELVPRIGELAERQTAGEELGLPRRNLLQPEYAIHNAAGYTVESNAGGRGISNHIVNTDLIHQNGLAMYDTHNLYGTSKFPGLTIESQNANNTSNERRQ
jgi:hypothetical protein